MHIRIQARNEVNSAAVATYHHLVSWVYLERNKYFMQLSRIIVGVCIRLKGVCYMVCMTALPLLTRMASGKFHLRTCALSQLESCKKKNH